jgi:signal recognition particle GTPase
MKILSEGVGTSEKDPKIVSIVGFGGLGKTTLAKALYDKLSKSYDCQGFVPVGQNQGAKKVLRDIVSQLDIELYKAAVTMEEWQLINQLQKFLASKRYALYSFYGVVWCTLLYALVCISMVNLSPRRT